MLRTVTSLIAPAVCLTLAAQDAPSKRAHHALIYDPVSERVLLFGGSSPRAGGECCDIFNDLWAFDGTRWTKLGESADRLSGVGLAYDADRRRVFSFGGYAPPSRGDLRVLENGAWRTSGVHPSIVAAEPGFVYDTRRERFIAFGGSAGRGLAHGDTWEYDGARWTKLEVESPPARQGHAMVYDARRGRTVIFGGSGSGAPGAPPPQLGDLWEFDGTTWRRITYADGPTPRSAAGVAYDTRRGLVLIFGGATAAGFLSDLWAWNGSTWTKLAEGGPPPRAMGYLAYDVRRDRVVLFGGRKGWPDDLNDTWEWDGTAWRMASAGTP